MNSMSQPLYNLPSHLLSNEQIAELVQNAIKKEREDKRQNYNSKGIRITPEKFFRSKLFKRGW